MGYTERYDYDKLPECSQEPVFIRTELLSKVTKLKAPALTVLTAGSGYGKTTLLRQFQRELAEPNSRSVWLDCRAMDVCSNLPSLQERNLNLFIDHYESLKDFTLKTFLEDTVRRDDATIRLFIASRSKVTLTETARIYGFSTLELGHSELAYQDSEFGQLPAMRTQISDRRLLKTQSHAEGWPLIQRFLLSNQREAQVSIDKFLVETLLGALDETELRFASELSFCRAFNIDLATKITQIARPLEALNSLQQKGIPVFSPKMNDGTQWYRFHPLVCEALQEACKTQGIGPVDQTHILAAEWFVENGFLFDALRHLCLVGDPKRIRQAIEESPIIVRSVSHIGLMRKLFGDFSKIALENDPKSLTLSAWLLTFLGEYDAVFDLIAKVRNLSRDVHQELAIQHNVILATAFISTDRVQEAQTLIKSIDRAKISNPFVMQAYVSAVIGAELGLNKFSAVLARSKVELVCRDETQNDEVSLIIRSQLLSGHLRHGHMQDVASLGRKLSAKAVSAHGQGSVTTNISSIFVAAAEYQLGNLDMAQAIIEKRLHTLRRGASQQIIAGLMVYASLLLAKKGPSAADTFLRDQSDWVADRGMVRCSAYLRSFRAACLLRLGQIEGARQLAREIREIARSRTDLNGYVQDIRILSYLTEARIAISDNRFQAAAIAAAKATELSQKAELHELCAVAQFLQGLAKSHFSQVEAIQHFCKGIETCQRHALLRTVLDSEVDWVRFLPDIEKIIPVSTWVWLQQDVLGLSNAEDRGFRDQQNIPIKPFVKLTPRESEIVDLLARFQTNKEIAQTLGLAPETIKWNMKNILYKFDASDRKDVVKKSRLLGRRNGL